MWSLSSTSPALDGFRNQFAHPAVVVGALCLAPFAKLLVPNDRVIPVGDYVRYQVPVRDFARGELLAGRLPLWIPYIGLGTPIHAAQQGAFCYPLLTPLVLCVGANIGNKLAIFLHLLICFGGQYKLARSFAISSPASAFAALVATQSGFLTSHLCAGHVNLVLQYALLPWFFLSLKLFLRTPGPRSAALLAVIVAILLFVGHPQVAYYALLAGMLWGMLSWCFGLAAAHRSRCAAWTATAAVVAVLTSAIQLVPSVELGRDGIGFGNRGSRDAAGQFALVPTDLFQFVFPTHKGHLFKGVPEYGMASFYQERAGYLGTVTLPLALYALTRRRTLSWYWVVATLAMLAVVVSLGNSTPLFGVFGKVLPGLFLFRCPGRIFCVVSIFLSLLAARGLDALARRQAKAPWPRIVGLGTASWLIFDLLIYALVESENSLDGYLRFVGSWLLGDVIFLVALAIVAAMFVVVWRRWRLSRLAMYATLISITSVDLWYFHTQYFQLELRPEARIPGALLATRPPLRFIEDANASSTALLHYCHYIHAAINHRRVTIGVNEGGVQPASLERVFRSIEINRRVATRLAACDYEYVERSLEWREIAGSMPRAWLCRGETASVCATPIEVISADQLSNAMDDSAQIEIIGDQPCRLNLRVRCPAPGKLIVVDLFYPGWQCHVNGLDAPIERAFGAFRAVDIVAGESRVVFNFEPPSFRRGALGSVVGLLLVALMLSVRPPRVGSRAVRRRRRARTLGAVVLALYALIPVQLLIMNHLGNRQIADLVTTPMGSKIEQANPTK